MKLFPYLKHMPLSYTYHKCIIIICSEVLKTQVYIQYSASRGLPRWLSGTESTGQCRRLRFHPWVGKIPWRRKWQPTPAFLPGNPMDTGAWRAAVPAVAKQTDTTEQLNNSKSCASFRLSPKFPTRLFPALSDFTYSFNACENIDRALYTHTAYWAI